MPLAAGGAPFAIYERITVAGPRSWGVGLTAAAYAHVAAGGSVQDAAELIRIQPSTVKRHLADLRSRMGLTTEQLIYAGRAAGWLLVPGLEPE